MPAAQCLTAQGYRGANTPRDTAPAQRHTARHRTQHSQHAPIRNTSLRSFHSIMALRRQEPHRRKIADERQNDGLSAVKTQPNGRRRILSCRSAYPSVRSKWPARVISEPCQNAVYRPSSGGNRQRFIVPETYRAHYESQDRERLPFVRVLYVESIDMLDLGYPATR